MDGVIITLDTVKNRNKHMASPSLIVDLENGIINGFDQVELRVCPPPRRFVNRCNFVPQEVRGDFPGLFLQLPAFDFSANQRPLGDGPHLATDLEIRFVFHDIADIHKCP